MRMARDNTVKYDRHTLQLLPSQQRRSYAGAAVLVLEGLDGRLFLQHEGGIIASQDGLGERAGGQESGPAQVIFAEENEPSLLGVVTLEDALLAVDPVEQRLVPVEAERL